MKVESYLFFEGRCEEAIIFYQKTLGVKVERLERYKDSPVSPETQRSPDKVMHGSFIIGETRVLVSDGRCRGKTNFSGFALTIMADSDAEAEKYFAALSENGQVRMPLATTFFASKFGMVLDQFGVMWMVLVST